MNKKVSVIILSIILFPIICVILGACITNSSSENKLSQQEDTTITTTNEIKTNEPEVEQEVEPEQNNCVVKVGNLCFKEPHMIKESSPYLTYQECKAEASALGIKGCYVEKDYWAGVVKECGGIDNVPSVDDMVILAKHLYGPTIKRCVLESDDNYDYTESKTCEYYNNKLQIDENSPFAQWIQNTLFPYPPRSGYDEEERKTGWQINIVTSTEERPDLVHEVAFRPQGINFIHNDKKDYRGEDWAMCVSRE